MAAPEPPELERTREMFEAWNNGGIERMPEFWTEDGDWVWEDAPDIPGAVNVRGTLTMIGDEVLADVSFEVAGGQSGVHLDATIYWLILYEEGRVRRFRGFMHRDQAVAAASS